MKIKEIPKGYYLLAAVALILLIIFVFVPMLKGYGMYRQMKAYGVPEEYLGDMQGLKDKNSGLTSSLDGMTMQRNQLTSSLQESQTTLESTKTSLETCTTNAGKAEKLCQQLSDSLAQEKSDIQADLTSCEDTAEGVLADAAKQLCCIKKVFDSSITGYKIDDDEIECVSEGGVAISC
ncbi:hypothetical protein GOV11_01485 [Candidatus Woesearchaeota archaeon]|nr:hypothetical protein [Candidatus Woesearchaeota archaeon]